MLVRPGGDLGPEDSLRLQLTTEDGGHRDREQPGRDSERAMIKSVHFQISLKPLGSR